MTAKMLSLYILVLQKSKMFLLMRPNTYYDAHLMPVIATKAWITINK